MPGGILEQGTRVSRTLFCAENWFQGLPATSRPGARHCWCDSSVQTEQGRGQQLLLPWGCQVFTQPGFEDYQWISQKHNHQNKLTQQRIIHILIVLEACAFLAVKWRWQSTFASYWHLLTDAGQHPLNTHPWYQAREQPRCCPRWQNHPVLAAGAALAVVWIWKSACSVLQPCFSNMWSTVPSTPD